MMTMGDGADPELTQGLQRAAAQSSDQIGDGEPADLEFDFSAAPATANSNGGGEGAGPAEAELARDAREGFEPPAARKAEGAQGTGTGDGGGDAVAPQALPPPSGPQPKPETNSNGGGADPRPLPPPPPKGADDYGANADEVAQKLAELNETHALVLVSNKVAVLREAISLEGEPTFTLMQPAAFHQWLANSFVTINENAVPISKLWIKSRKRRHYEGICVRARQAAAIL